MAVRKHKKTIQDLEAQLLLHKVMAESDIPDLVYSSDEDECGYVQRLRLAGKNVDVKRLRHKGWDRDGQEKLVKIYTLAPFLFGKVFQPDIWIRYLYEVGLLPSPTPTSVDALDDKYMFVVEVMEYILHVVCTEVKADQEMHIKNLNGLFDIVDHTVFSMKPMKPKSRPVAEILDRASGFPFLHAWKDKVKDKFKDDKIQLSDREIVVAMLFACRQYVENAYRVTESMKLLEEFKSSTDKSDQKIQEKKEEGNKEFKAGSFIQASQLYTQAIYISPFNHILYGNRAQSYLNCSSYKAALSDGKRAIVLAPQWHKGYYRYAQAFWELGEKDQAFDAIERGLDNCPSDKNLLDQRSKFKNEGKESNNNQETNGTIDGDSDEDEDTDSDDVPALTSSSEDNESDDEDLPELVDTEDSEPDTEENKFKALSDKERERRYHEKEVRRAEERKRKKEAEFKRQQEERRRKKEEEKKERKRLREQKEREKSTMMKVQQKEDRQVELYDTLRQGSEALWDQRAQNAVFFFNKALDMITDFSIAYFVRFGEIDLILLKYSVGTGSVAMGTNKDIQLGVKWFQEIVDKHSGIKFPLALLGLGRAYYKQCRFDDALTSLKRGIVMVKTSQHGIHTKCTWPGTTKVIEETKPGQLKIALEDLVIQCRNPPPPDAICRYNKCQGHYYKVKIYITDPDFKGFVRLMCFAKCIIEYHIECWRKFKKERLSQSDKDYLNTPCSTPDCSSKVAKIHTYDHCGTRIKELDPPEQYSAPRVKKPKSLKMKPSSTSTIERRVEKKRARKAQKQEVRRQKELEEASNDATDIIDRIHARHSHQGDGEAGVGVITGVQVNECDRVSSSDGSGDAQIDLDKYMTVLNKKEEESTDQQKPESRPSKSKNKKKQRVAKVTMSLDEFVGPSEPSPVTPATSMDCMDEFDEDPFRQPEHLRDELESFENLYDNSSMASSETEGKTADIKDTLFSFFTGILSEHGPLHRDDIIIQRELGDFPVEAHDIISKAGGIDKFLLQSLQFAVIDNFVCLLHDTVKARQLAELDKNPLTSGKISATTIKHKTPKSKPVSDMSLVEEKSNKLDELDTFITTASVPRETVSKVTESLLDTFNSNGTSSVSDLDDFGGKSEDLIPKTAENPKSGPTGPPGPSNQTGKGSAQPQSKTAKKQSSSSKGGSKSEKKKSSSGSVKGASDKSSAVERNIGDRKEVKNLECFKDDFKKQVFAVAGKELEQNKPSVAERIMKNNRKASESSPKKGVNSPRNSSTPEPDLQVNSSNNNDDNSRSKTSNKKLDNIKMDKYKSEFIMPVNGENKQVTIESSSHESSSLVYERKSMADCIDDFNDLEEDCGGLINDNSIDSCDVLDELNHLDINLHNAKQSETAQSPSKSLEEVDMWKKMTISDITAPSLDWGKATETVTTSKQDWVDEPTDSVATTTAASQPNWHEGASLQWGSIAQEAHKYNPSFTDFAPSVKDIAQEGRDLGPIGSRVSTPNSEDISIGTKFGPIGSHSKSYSPAHGSSSKSSSVTGTPIHTPQTDTLPHFPSLHSNTEPFNILNPDTFANAPRIISQESEADKYNDETFGIPAELSETSQDYIPEQMDPIPIVASSTGLPFMNRSVWSHDQQPARPPLNNKLPIGLHPTIDDSLRTDMNVSHHNMQQYSTQSTMNLIGHNNIEESVQNEVNRHDDLFVKEMVDSVYDQICDNESFKENPNLREDIKADVLKDIQRSKRSALVTETKPRKTKVKVKLCDVMCQYERNEMSTATNTEPYEPFKQDYLKTLSELEITRSRLQELMDKHTQLQNSSGIEIRSLRSLVDALEQECKGLRRERRGAIEERDAEIKKWTNEKRALADEVKTLRKDLKNAKYREEHVSNLLGEQQQKVGELSEQVNAERETMVSERQRLQRELNDLQEKHSTQLSRAENSEVKFLQLKVDVGTQILDRSLKDAEMYATQLTTLIQGMRDNKQSIPPPMQTSCDQWKSTVQKIRDIKEKSMLEFEDQIGEVRQGTPLATLPLLQIPRPPPPPENNIINAMLRGAPSGFLRGPTPPSVPIQSGPIQMPPPGLLPPGALTRPSGPSKQAGRPPSTPSPMPGCPAGMYRNVVRPPQAHKSKNAYEKVMDMLAQMFPSYAKTELNILIQELRSSRNGSLSGMSLEQIVRRVADMVLRKQQQKMSMVNNRMPPSATHVNPPPVAMGTTQGSALDVDEIFEEEEDPCIICHDELEPDDSITLECGHRYHGECIKKWFNEQSTCPTCRVHALLPEDFPSLG